MTVRESIEKLRSTMNAQPMIFNGASPMNFGHLFFERVSDTACATISETDVIIFVELYGRRISFSYNEGAVLVDLMIESFHSGLYDYEVAYHSCFNATTDGFTEETTELFCLSVAKSFWDMWICIADNTGDHDIDFATFIEKAIGLSLPA